MATETPSKEFKYVLIPEDHSAFRNKEAAIRHIKKRWAAQEPAERNSYYFAEVKSLLEPQYAIGIAETDIETDVTKESGVIRLVAGITETDTEPGGPKK